MTVGLLSLGGLAPYLGYAATRTSIPLAVNTTNFQYNSRSFHFARTTITSLKVGYAAWRLDDVNNTNGAVVKASIEYQGTFTQVTWNGGATSFTSVQPTTISDAVPVSIPNGDKFYIRFFVDGTAVGGVAVDQEYNKNTVGGDALEWAPSGLSDRTMSGSVPDTSDPSTSFSPVLLLTNTTRPSIAIFGDSIAYGNNDAPDATGDTGSIARAIGGTFAYAKAAIPGTTVANFLTTHANRAALAQYATHIINEYGTNDLFLDHKTSSQLAADQASFRSIFPGKPIIQVTISPNTHSSDNWTTLANQTITDSTDETQRLAYNALVRAGISGVAHYAEAADAMESSRDSGKWKVDGVTLRYGTSDGVHPSPLIYQNLMSTIDTAWFTYP